MFDTSGGVHLQREIVPVSLFRYNSLSSVFWLLMDILLYLLVFVGICLVVQEMMELGFETYFKSWLNVFEVFNLLLYVVILIGRIWLEVLMASRDHLLQDTGTVYAPLYSVAYFERLLETINGFNTILSLGRLLKYVSIHPQVGLFTVALNRAARTLFWLSFVAGLLFFSYGLGFHLAYRMISAKYADFGGSLVELTSMILGKAKSEDVVSSEPFLGRLLYLSFVVLIFFIFLKLFITTLSESYARVMHTLRHGGSDTDNNLYIDTDDERWELVKEAALEQIPLIGNCLDSNVMSIHEARKKVKIKNALEDADLEVHAESIGRQVARMEAMVMQIGSAVGVHLTRDEETDCVRSMYAAEQEEAQRARRQRRANA